MRECYKLLSVLIEGESGVYMKSIKINKLFYMEMCLYDNR